MLVLLYGYEYVTLTYCSYKFKVGNPKVSIQWFPRFGALKDALQVYGYSSCPGSFSPSVPVNNGERYIVIFF